MEQSGQDKMLKIYSTWKEWSYLESLAESNQEDLKPTPRILELGIQRINYAPTEKEILAACEGA